MLLQHSMDLNLRCAHFVRFWNHCKKMQQFPTLQDFLNNLTQQIRRDMIKNLAARFDDFNKPPELIQFAIAVKSLHTKSSNICIE